MQLSIGNNENLDHMKNLKYQALTLKSVFSDENGNVIIKKLCNVMNAVKLFVKVVAHR